MKALPLLIGIGLLALLGGRSAYGQAALEVYLSSAVGGAFSLTAPPERFALPGGIPGDRVVRNGRFGHSYALGGSVGLRVAGRGVVEGTLFWVPTELTADGGVAGEGAAVDAYLYTANLLFLLPRLRGAEPFLSLGLGAVTRVYDLPGTGSQTDFLWSFGPGTTLPLSDRWGVRIDLRDCVTSFDPRLAERGKEPAHELLLLVGLSYRALLGGTAR